MPHSSPYFKGFVGSLIIHSLLLFCLIVGFNQRTVLTSQHRADSLIQAVMVESPASKASPTPDPQAQQALQAEQQRQLAQEKIVDAAKVEQLKKDMLMAKKIAADQKEPEKTESPAIEKPDLAAIAVQEEHLAEQARLKAVHLAKEKEQKKRAQHIKEQKALKAAAALKAQDEARKTKIAEEYKRMAAEKARLAAHQSQISNAVSSVVLEWKGRIENNRRLMPEFQSLAQDLSCKITLQILPDGSARAQLVQSSGNPRYDDLALKAIYKAEPFTLPEDPEVRDKVKTIEFNFLNGE